MLIALYAEIEVNDDAPPLDLQRMQEWLEDQLVEEDVEGPAHYGTKVRKVLVRKRDKRAKMDKKFFGAVFKVKDDSLVQDDEYITFLVKDDCFDEVLPQYLSACVQHGCDDDQVREVEKLVDRVAEWRDRNSHRLKKPDAQGETLLP